ncbi:MAG: DUF5995 family protein [Actinomycetota bacterium]|nr:DUF5995 family protein [Actinomycetota bacterium]
MTSPILPTPENPAATLDEVVTRMLMLEATLPAGDGVGYFNKLYLEVTRAVVERLRRGEFEQPLFLEHLAVLFSNAYFRALDDFERDPATVSRAWAPLLEARANKRVAPIQFVLAGMNAHINYDLPIGVVETCESFGVSPRDGTAEHRDYLHLNAILGETQEAVKKWLVTGLLGFLDRALGRLDDVVASFSVLRAREAAWAHAKTLWEVRGQRELTGVYLDALGHTVGFAGRGLLRPTLLGLGGWASRRPELPAQLRTALGAPKLGT